MSMASNLSFDSLNRDEFYYTFQTQTTPVHDLSNRELSFQDELVEQIDFQNDNLEFNFDSNDSTTQAISQYYTEDQFISNFLLNDKEFSMLHLNIRSANKNFDSLRVLIEGFNYNCSVIGLSETWFSDHSPSLVSLPDYNLVVNNRPDKAGGGVGMFISRQFEYEVRNELTFMNSNIETIFVEIIIPGNKNIIIGTFYRPPRSNSNDFLNCMQQILTDPVVQNKQCFFMGDFNINLFHNHSSVFIQIFLDTLVTESFLPLITKPTRIKDNSSTLIDNIFTNVQPLPKSAIILSDISDHFPIFASFPLLRTSVPKAYVHTRLFTQDNILSLKSSLLLADWSGVFNSNDPDHAFEIFVDKLTVLLNEKIPIIKKKINNKKKISRSPWITKSILRSINRKNNLYLKYQAKPTQQNKMKYIRYKNILTTLLRREKNCFIHDKEILLKMILRALGKQ